MRPRRFALAAACTWAVVTLCGCTSPMTSSGDIRGQPFDELVHRMALMRGIQPERPIDARVVERAELDRILRRALLEEWSGSDLRHYQKALNAMGLWPPDRDLLDEYLGVLGEEAAGIYLASEGKLYLVADGRPPGSVRSLSAEQQRDLLRDGVLGHEIVHWLQHQAYPQLLEPDPFYRSQDDLSLALQAALEGDALLYEIRGTESGPLPVPEDKKRHIEADIGPATLRGSSEPPALIRLTLTFPYAEGYRLAYHEGQELLERPPASTEQVLHGDKRYESFLAFDLRPVAAALPSRCRVLHANTMGELGLSVLFRDLGEGVSSQTWKGWDGDRYVAADCEGRPEFLWITAWDSEKDAEEFESAYAGVAEAVAERGALAAPPETTRFHREVYIVTSGLAELRDDLSRLPRRRRVSNVEALREHFEATSASSGDGRM